MNRRLSGIPKPSYHTLLLARWRSWFQTPYVSIGLPKTIGKYTLVKPIVKTHEFTNFFIGIYSFHKKKLFIKTWIGHRKDLHYYLLINEYRSTQLLYKKFLSLKTQSPVRIPKPIAYIQTPTTLSVMYEYIPGKLLREYNKKEQSKVIRLVLESFATVTKSLTTSERKQLETKTAKFYLFSLPLIFFYALIRNIGKYNLFIPAFVKSITEYRLTETSLVLTHSDINQENIMVYKSAIYILDSERIVLTNPFYEKALLAVRPETRNLHLFNENVKENGNFLFLSIYVCFHNIVNYVKNYTYKNYYVRILQSL